MLRIGLCVAGKRIKFAGVVYLEQVLGLLVLSEVVVSVDRSHIPPWIWSDINSWLPFICVWAVASIPIQVYALGGALGAYCAGTPKINKD